MHHSTVFLAGTFGFEVGAQLRGIQVVGAFVNVHKVGERTGLRDGFGGGDERMRNGNYNIARPNAGGGQGKAKRVGAAAYASAMLGVAKLREGTLKLLDLGAADESGARDGGPKRGHQFLLQLQMLGDQIKKWNIASCHLLLLSALFL